MYRYTLEKYRGPASRHTCPACGRKREFTRYVDMQTGRHLSPEVGKCNRESNCGYYYTPKQYFADHPQVAQADFRPTATSMPQYNKPRALPEPFDTIDRKYLARSVGMGSDFITWLSKYFPDETIRRIVEEYAVGQTKDRRVIFWEQDTEGHIRTGTVMRYNPKTGRRIKEPGTMDWIHAILKRRGRLPETFRLRQCLFGEHLLAKYPDATVALVESSKSALAGKCAMPEYIWCATGGKAGFSAERCRALAGRNVILYPDLDAHYDWLRKAPEIAREVGCRIEVSQLLLRNATPEQCKQGFDIADFVTDRIWNGAPIETIADKLREEEQAAFNYLFSKNPLLGDLVHKLDLVSERTGQPFIIPSL